MFELSGWIKWLSHSAFTILIVMIFFKLSYLKKIVCKYSTRQHFGLPFLIKIEKSIHAGEY